MKTLLCLLALLSSPRLALKAADKLPPGEKYAVVEVGASGIKGSVIETVAAEPNAESPPIRLLKPYEPQDKNAFLADSSKSGRVADAVAAMRKEMETDFQIPKGHFYLVGSSGLPPEVKAGIEGSTSDIGTIEYIDPKRESELVFKGIVPPHRLSQVVVLDIGSGNSKGAYLEKLSPKMEFSTFSVQLGSKTFAQEVNKQRKDGAMFMVAADALRGDLLLPQVRSQVTQFAGMQNSPRLYLAGGISWAMATLSHPDQVGPNDKGIESDWIRISYEDIEKFCQAASTNPELLLQPDMSKVRAENRSKAESEIARIGKVFNQDQLMSGALILKTFTDEMHAKSKKAIFFSKRALNAWPQGYLLEKLYPQNSGH